MSRGKSEPRPCTPFGSSKSGPQQGFSSHLSQSGCPPIQSFGICELTFLFQRPRRDFRQFSAFHPGELAATGVSRQPVLATRDGTKISPCTTTIPPPLWKN